MALVASPPPWRCRFGSSAGGGRLLSSESFYFCACLRSLRQYRPGCIGRRLMDALLPCSLVDTLSMSALADTLPPLSSASCLVVALFPL